MDSESRSYDLVYCASGDRERLELFLPAEQGRPAICRVYVVNPSKVTFEAQRNEGSKGFVLRNIIEAKDLQFFRDSLRINAKCAYAPISYIEVPLLQIIKEKNWTIRKVNLSQDGEGEFFDVEFARPKVEDYPQALERMRFDRTRSMAVVQYSLFKRRYELEYGSNLSAMPVVMRSHYEDSKTGDKLELVELKISESSFEDPPSELFDIESIGVKSKASVANTRWWFACTVGGVFLVGLGFYLRNRFAR